MIIYFLLEILNSDKVQDKKCQCDFHFLNMRTWLLISLVLLTMITVIEANCACRINRQSEKNPSLQVTKNRCFGSVPELRIVEKKYGLKTYKSCRCTCVPVGYLKHQSDHLIRINWTKNIKQNKCPFLSAPFLRPSDNVLDPANSMAKS